MSLPAAVASGYYRTGSEAVPRDPLKDGMRLGRFGRALGYLPLPELAQQAIIRLISEPALDRHRSRSTFGLSIDISSRVPCPDSAVERQQIDFGTLGALVLVSTEKRSWQDELDAVDIGVGAGGPARRPGRARWLR